MSLFRCLIIVALTMFGPLANLRAYGQADPAASVTPPPTGTTPGPAAAALTHPRQTGWKVTKNVVSHNLT